MEFSQTHLGTTENWLAGTLLPKAPDAIPAPQFSTLGTVASTLTIASAVSIGSNMVDVKNGGMTFAEAVANGLVKGTAATIIINATARSTALQVGLAAAVLAGAGYTIDTLMKKSKQELCRVDSVEG